MPALFLSLLACLLLTLCGRDQVRVARLSAMLGAGTGLFVAIWLSAMATSALAAWAATLLAPLMPPAARHMFVALSLGLAAAELIVLRPGKPPREPTRSAGAILLVLLAAQLTDSARLLVLALVLATGDPVFAAVGGALGSGAALSIAALAGAQWERRVPVRLLSHILAGVLLLGAIVIGLQVRGIFG